ncbi:MAG: GTP-binding protein [Acidobacteriota bacterium]
MSVDFWEQGKTTFLAAAAQELTNRGLKVGILTNDQGSRLVDTQVFQAMGLTTEAITGGCFCCRFQDLISHAESVVRKAKPDVLLAEAVGSCTDLWATVYQPLRRFHRQRFHLVPLTVMVDPARLRAVLGNAGSALPAAFRYLFEHQLAEADWLVLTKSDQLEAAESTRLTQILSSWFPATWVHEASAQYRKGVSVWVDRLLVSEAGSGNALRLDYQTYADAEAALGWLNATAEVTAQRDFSPAAWAETFAREVRLRCRDDRLQVAHFKVLVAGSERSDRLALTENDGELIWTAGTPLGSASAVTAVINARIEAVPDKLKEIVEQSLWTAGEALGVRTAIQDMECFSPTAPQPTYRFSAVKRR